jgi:diamine N-acetyltransferase
MIAGERVRFRSLERDDIPTFIPWLNDPEVQQGILLHNPVSRANEENWFEEMLKRPAEEQVMGIEVRVVPAKGGEESWQLVGSLAFNDIDWRNRAAEFGILIGDKDFWDQGFGTEAVCLLLRHGFDTLNLNRIYLQVFANNPRAIRAYEKAGFIHEGNKRQAEYRNRKYIDVLMMSLLKDEYCST